MARKRERTTENDRQKIKQWKGPALDYDTLFLSLPVNHWQKNRNYITQRIWVDFKCRACGFVHSIIGPQYTIANNGSVDPKYRATGNMCAIDEWLQLQDWVPEEVKQDG